MNKLRIVLVLVALLLSFAPFSLVVADAPVQEVYVWEESGLLEDNPCDFDIEFYAELRVVVVMWLDQDGNITHEIFNWAGSKDTIFTSANSVVLHRGGQIRFDYLPDSQTIIKVTGNNWTGTIPGYGIFTGSVGSSEVLVDDETGEVTVLKEALHTFDNPEAFCAYLQPYPDIFGELLNNSQPGVHAPGWLFYLNFSVLSVFSVVQPLNR